MQSTIDCIYCTMEVQVDAKYRLCQSDVCKAVWSYVHAPLVQIGIKVCADVSAFVCVYYTLYIVYYCRYLDVVTNDFVSFHRLHHQHLCRDVSQ